MVNAESLKVGQIVLVPWGLEEPVKARVVEVWDAAHVRVELLLADEDKEAEPVVLLLSPAVLSAA